MEICLNGSWVLVCDSSWNVNQSTVVCRKLTGELNPSEMLLLARKVGHSYIIFVYPFSSALL